MPIDNVFNRDGTPAKEELVKKLLEGGRIVRLEKVVSLKSDEPSIVYDQEEEEFVMVVRGYAELEFERDQGREIIIMSDGDYMFIPAHLKHRVVKADEGTTWLALFYKK